METPSVISSPLKPVFFLLCLLAISFYTFSQSITDGLVGFYPFDGDANDKSIISPVNNGTTVGASFECGPIDSALVFNSKSGYVKLNNNFPIASSYSISFWLKPKDIQHGSVFAMRSQCPNSFRGWDRANITLSGLNERDYLKHPSVSTTNQLVMTHFRSNLNCDGWSNLYAYTVAGVKIDTSCFTHLVIAVENNSSNANRDYSIYINGQFYEDTLFNIPVAANLANTVDPFNIPAAGFESFFGIAHNNFNEPTNQFPFEGALDHVRFYNRKITAGEVQLLYNERKKAATPTIVSKKDTLCINEFYTVSVSPVSDCDDYQWFVNGSFAGSDTSITIRKRRELPDEISLIYSPRDICETEFITKVFYSIPIFRDTVFKTICKKDSVLFGNEWKKEAGTYSDTISCDNIKTLVLTVIDFPITKTLGNDTVVCDDRTLLLDVSTAAASYLWQDGSTDSTFLVTEAGKYTVAIKTTCAFKQNTIEVDFVDCRCYISVPNVFTPNGDGINDEFFPLSKCEYVSFQFLVFNRWGVKIFESNSANKKWDGLQSGQSVSEGVYHYILNYKTEREEGVLKGNVVLTR